MGGAGSRPWHRLARLSRRASAAAGRMVVRRSGLGWRGRGLEGGVRHRLGSAGCGEERLVLCLLACLLLLLLLRGDLLV